MKTCCFTGHRRISESGKHLLYDGVLLHACRLTRMGVTDFICGGALGFDTIAAQAVLALRERRPDIRLILYLPCENQTLRWTHADKIIYEQIKEAADEVRYISKEYDADCMMRRNRAMVDAADVCVYYLNHNFGGTAATVNYARERGIFLIDVNKTQRYDLK